MTDTFAPTPERLAAQAAESLRVIDEQIDAMREQKRGLGVAIAQALESRKPLARMVAAAAPRTRKSPKSNGDVA